MLDELYDELLADHEGTLSYADFTRRHARGIRCLELACGSGDLLVELEKMFPMLSGLDTSQVMLDKARQKAGDQVQLIQADMCRYRSDILYDTLLCFGDSINYLLSEESVRDFVSTTCALATQRILLDLHHPSRLAEFQEGYVEEGVVEGVEYLWQIQSSANRLYHQFTFYTEPMVKESVTQQVYSIDWLITLYREQGWSAEVYTDFTIHGKAEGEKYFLVLSKEVA